MIRIAFALVACAALADAFSHSSSPLTWRGPARTLCLRTNGGLRMSGQPDVGRGSDADIAAAYFREQEDLKKKAEEDALKPKKTIDLVDEDLEKWKADKEAERAKQEADVEARMAAWMKAAEDKKNAGG
mmetsp:Transcript_37769/g.92843  ORF Transcript_37769/g.92843 Transcript_37769/m.92843 type:complete len:129 (+) Transcript_37769:54-440(+)